MGIIGKFFLDTTLKAAGKVIIESGVAGKAVDAISPKLNKATKTMTNEEAVNDSSFEYHLIVKNISSRNVENCFNIFDADDNQKYTVKRPSSNWKYEIHIYNSKRQKIGVIKEHKPFFKEVYEVEERTCDIELNDKYIGQVRTYETSTGIELSFNYNGFSVSRNIFNTKIEIFKKGNLVCRINHQFATTDSRGKYVISYNDKEYEEAFVLFTIAMDKINSSSY